MPNFLKRIYWFLTGTDASTFLRPSIDHINQYKSQVVWKKVGEINNCRIPTYPRFTIFDKSISERDKQVMFDSSDFSTINKAIGNGNDVTGISITEGFLLEVKGVEHRVTRVQIDVLNFFHDYSNIDQYAVQETKPIKTHTSAYEGRDIPYNIQIIIEVNG